MAGVTAETFAGTKQRWAAMTARSVFYIDGAMRLERLMSTVARRMGEVDRKIDMDFEKLANRNGEIAARQKEEGYFSRILG